MKGWCYFFAIDWPFCGLFVEINEYYNFFSKQGKHIYVYIIFTKDEVVSNVNLKKYIIYFRHLSNSKTKIL